MKRAELYALIDDKEAILVALQKCGEFMALPLGSEGEAASAQEAGAQKTLETLKFIAKKAVKAPLVQKRPEVAFEQLVYCPDDVISAAREAEQLKDDLSHLQGEKAQLAAEISQYEPWEKLDVKTEDISPTRFTDCRTGFVPLAAFEKLANDMQSMGCHIETFGDAPEGVTVFAVWHKDDAGRVKELFDEAGFAEASVKRERGTPSQALIRLRGQLAHVDERIAALEKKAAQLAEDKSALQILFEQQTAAQKRSATGAEYTETTFRLDGWVRADKTAAIENALASVTDVFELSFRDPTDDELPPTVVENSKWVTPFEFVTNLYSRPNPRSIDPNPLMAPFFFIFFGMMVSDAVYGLLLAAGAYAYLKVFKPKGSFAQLVTLLIFGGVSTAVWGAMFGGWFGFELKPILFVPMNNPLPMLILCFAFGVVQIFAGLIIKAYMMMRDGDFIGAFADNISWVCLISGLLLLVSPVKIAGYVLAIAGVALILLFGGREKTGIVGKFVGGLSSLYGIMNYFSDILSYSRLFALGLATGVIGMVINTLCSMVAGSGVWALPFALIIMLGGHLFNIVINTLGAYVHASRLQYIEYYGKFFESGGKEFTPLAFNPVYVDIV